MSLYLQSSRSSSTNSSMFGSLSPPESAAVPTKPFVPLAQCHPQEFNRLLSAQMNIGKAPASGSANVNSKLEKLRQKKAKKESKRAEKNVKASFETKIEGDQDYNLNAVLQYFGEEPLPEEKSKKKEKVKQKNRKKREATSETSSPGEIFLSPKSSPVQEGGTDGDHIKTMIVVNSDKKKSLGFEKALWKTKPISPRDCDPVVRDLKQFSREFVLGSSEPNLAKRCESIESFSSLKEDDCQTQSRYNLRPLKHTSDIPKAEDRSSPDMPYPKKSILIDDGQVEVVRDKVEFISKDNRNSPISVVILGRSDETEGDWNTHDLTFGFDINQNLLIKPEDLTFTSGSSLETLRASHISDANKPDVPIDAEDTAIIQVKRILHRPCPTDRGEPNWNHSALKDWLRQMWRATKEDPNVVRYNKT